MAISIDCDMGESFGLYKMGDDVGDHAVHHARQRGLRFPCVRPERDAADGTPGKRAGRRRGRPPIAAGSSRLWASRDEGRARRAHRGDHLSGRGVRHTPPGNGRDGAREGVREPSVPFVREFYADLEYDDGGNLIITREHAAVDAEAAAARTLRAIRAGKVRSNTGKDVPVVVESVCVHSDTPGAVAVARAVRSALAEYLD